MITLSDHSCEHCKHLSRPERTQHGWLADQYRETDELLEQALHQNKFGLVAYFRDEKQRIFQRMRNIEQGMLSSLTQASYYRKVR